MSDLRAAGVGDPHRTANERLARADWLHAPATRAVFAALDTPGVAVRAVGGTVRNTILGAPVTDIDLATTAVPQATMAAAAAAGLKAIPTGLQHGTVTVVAHGEPFEVTTLRRDVATDGRHAQVAFTDDWHGDAARRDFTMNALYCTADGQLFDPLEGLADCLARRVRFIGDADQRIAEDYLRIVRFYRFAAQYGPWDGHGHEHGDGHANRHGQHADRQAAIDPAGRRACTRGRSGLGRLSRERIGAEMLKLLVGPAAPVAVEAMFLDGVLVDLIGAVPRQHRFAAWHGLANRLGAQMPAVGLAALAGAAPATAASLSAQLRLSNEQHRLIAATLTWSTALQTEGWASGAQAARRGALRALRADAGDEVAQGALQIALATAASRGGPISDPLIAELDALLQAPLPDFPLKGRDLVAAGLTPGPDVGQALAALRAEWLASDLSLSRQELLARLEHMRRSREP